MYNQELFNPNYINEIQYNELLRQKAYLDHLEFEMNQKKEIGNMLKALNDYFDAAQKIAPQYQQDALKLCVLEIYRRLNNM